MSKEKELLDKMNKDKDYRTKVLIDLNVTLQQAQRVTASEYDEWGKFEEFKIAVVSLETEIKSLENKLKQANATKEEEKRRKEKAQDSSLKNKRKYYSLLKRTHKVIDILNNFDAWLEPQDTLKIKRCIEILKGGKPKQII